MDSSSFSDKQLSFPDAELLPVSGSTCDCYRVRYYGKLHFLKQLKSELRTDPRYVSALHKEFETGFRLDHPHLVRYVEKGDDYLLTEYVDGETLKQFTVSHPDFFKNRKNINQFLTQLLDVVGYLHQHQIVHLDLKPDNILITRIGQKVKLTDLGFCYSDVFTDTMGRTDQYAAPEQLQGRKVDARTDIYAIGKILETLHLPYIYNKVVKRCTQFEPANRYQTTEEMLQALTRNSKLYRMVLTIVICMIIGFILWPHQSEIQETIEQPSQMDSSVFQKQIGTSGSYRDSISSREHSSEPEAKKHDLGNDLTRDIQYAVKTNVSKVMNLKKDTAWWNTNRLSPKADLKTLNIISAKELAEKYPSFSKDYIQNVIDNFTITYLDTLSEE
jgi:Serine/threonine protein kinase